MRTKYEFKPTWRLIIRDLGLDEVAVLRRAGLPLDIFNGPDVNLAWDDYYRFWDALEAESGDPAFPIHMCRAIPTEAFSPMLFAALSSPNFWVASERIGQYKRLISPMKVHRVETDSYLELAFECLEATQPLPASFAALELVFMVQFARTALRGPLTPLRIQSHHELKPEGAYTDFFGVKPVRGPINALRLRKADALRPFLTANQGMWDAFEPSLKTRLSQVNDAATTGDRTRAVLLEGLPSGQFSTDTVAKRLGMSKRTLQRRLGAENTYFQRVLNATRQDLAKHYLSTTDLSVAEVSYLLGFHDPNSFFRAFRDWLGLTPGEFRQSHAMMPT